VAVEEAVQPLQVHKLLILLIQEEMVELELQLQLVDVQQLTLEAAEEQDITVLELAVLVVVEQV
tara:strand:- start:26 stop:217 length:192 start_codon:yes stop_codon:yes gene_type:complete